MDALKTIKRLAKQSQLAWEVAVDTAGPEYAGGSVERAQAMQDLADACETEYDHAIEMLERQDSDDWRDAAMLALETARTLESEGGDSSHALAAIEALDAV